MNVSELIADALEQSGAVDPASTPTAQQSTQALRVLQQVINNLPGQRWWTDVVVTADYTAGENERISVNTSDAVTITVPSLVSSAEKVLFCCNQIELKCSGYDDRVPKDGARVWVNDLQTTDAYFYMYRSDIAQWTSAKDLTPDSDLPLSEDWHEGLSAMLAARLARYYGLPLEQVTVALATATESRMRARFGKRQQIAVDTPLLRTSSNQIWETT